MSSRKWALAGGILGASAVTAVGVYLAVRELQTPAFSARTQTYVAGVAERAANDHLAIDFGITSERIRQFQQIAARLSPHR